MVQVLGHPRRQRVSPAGLNVGLPLSFCPMNFLRTLALPSTQRVSVHGASVDSATWDELYGRAARCALLLMREYHVGIDSRVLFAGPVTLDAIALMWATWLAGGSISVLPVSDRAAPAEADEFRRRTELLRPSLIAVSGGCEGITIEHPYNHLACDPTSLRVRAERIQRPPLHSLPSDLPGDRELIVQFTSGSTGRPKALRVTHDNLVANCAAITARAAFDSSDRFCTWLPHYHDMGLIGFLIVPMMVGAQLDIIPVDRFRRNPFSWVQLASDVRATVTGAPNSAYALLAKWLDRRASRIDLSALRLAFNGSEQVHGRTVRSFTEATKSANFRPEAMYPVYGMAEATLAVSMPYLGVGPQSMVVSSTLAVQDRAPAGSNLITNPLIAVGNIVEGVEASLVVDGTVLARSELRNACGELVVRGPSIVDSYLDAAGVLQSNVDSDGWYRTGDIAHSRGSLLAIASRISDVIIVGGRNYAPHVIEDLASEIPGVRQGRVAAIGVPDDEAGTERLVIIAETDRRIDPRTTRSAIADHVRASLGITPRDVVLVSPSAIPRTSSGKIQRVALRAAYRHLGV